VSRGRAPLAVAAARLRAHRGRSLLVVLGVAATTSMLLGVIGGSLVARDRAVARSLGALSPADRSFRVDAFGLPPGESYAGADSQARASLRLLASGLPLRASFFRELRIDHELTQLVGLDTLARFVRLREGRLPRECTPARCEVLQIGATGETRLDEGEIHLVRVGIADLQDRAVFGSSLATLGIGGDAPVLLLADGGHVFDALPAFDGIFRTYTWIAPVDPNRLHVWDIARVLESETRAQGDLARVSDVFRLSGPDQALLDARETGRASAQRLALVGGEASTLLLGFAIVVAVGMRRGLANERRRLRQRGASRGQTFVATAGEIGALTLLGTALGACLGGAAVSIIAWRAGLPAGGVLAHSLRSPTVAGLVVGVWLMSTGALIAAATTREGDPPPRRVGLLDVAAGGALGAAGLGLARGGLDSTSASGGSRVLLLLLPGLICFIAAVAVARLLQPLMRVGERIARRSGALVPRLALLALSRSPARTKATAAFLVVGVGLALFAASWRATLERGAQDQAAFQVPLDVTLTEGGQLVQPLDLASIEGYARLAPGVTAFPVVRRLADVAGEGASVASPTLLGLPAAAIGSLHWRSDFSSLPQDEIARRIGRGGQAELRGVALPTAGAGRVATLRVTLRGDPVELALVALDSAGHLDTVTLGEHVAGSFLASARLPRTATQVVALEISLASSTLLGYTHRNAEAETASVPGGSLVLGRLVVGGKTVTAWHGFVGRRGLQVRGAGQLRLAYSFTEGQTMVLRPPQQTDRQLLRVIASPEIARSSGRGGALVLDVQGTRVPATVVGVADRFPAAQEQGEGFVVADESRLRTALDADVPGSGTPTEVWLAARDPAHLDAALARPPFSSLDRASRLVIERGLVSDPLARGIAIALGVAAVLALALALLGFWIALVSELRDERGELFDLEAQGVSPTILRRQLKARAALLLAFALVAGAGLGWALSRLVVSTVRASAGTEPADPPLRLDLGLGFALAAVAVLVAGSALAVELVTRRAFGGAAPERSSWSLE
jgi:hypothetical protein